MPMARPKSIDTPSQAMPSSSTAAWYLGVLENKNSLLFPQPRQNMLQRRTQPRKPYGFDNFFSNFSLPLKHPPFSFVTTKLHSSSLKTIIIERGPSTSTSAIILFVKSHKMGHSNQFIVLQTTWWWI